jgi:hypothetical protein
MRTKTSSSASFPFCWFLVDTSQSIEFTAMRRRYVNPGPRVSPLGFETALI